MNWDNHFFSLDAAWEHIEKSNCLSKRHWILEHRQLDISMLKLMIKSSLLVEEHINYLNQNHVDGIFLLALHRVLERQDKDLSTAIKYYLESRDKDLWLSLTHWEAEGKWDLHLSLSAFEDYSISDREYTAYNEVPGDQIQHWYSQGLEEANIPQFKAEKNEWLLNTPLCEWVKHLDWSNLQDAQFLVSCVYGDLPEEKKLHLYNAPMFKEAMLYLIVLQTLMGVPNVVLEDTSWFSRKSGHQMCTLMDVFSYDLTVQDRAYVQHAGCLPLELLEKWKHQLFPNIPYSLEELRSRVEVANNIGFDETNHPLRNWTKIKGLLLEEALDYAIAKPSIELPVSTVNI